ncbi:MAG TPA: SMP-30/gluconolactonase/LRE family protein [Chloroflexota bacterium]
MAIVALDERLATLVDLDAQAHQIASGFRFTEGPVWDRRSQSLTFSDIPNDTLHRWTAADGAQVFRRPSAHANGNTLDRQGRLITCEHESRRVTRTNPDGSVEVLATHYAGKRFNSPNDVICTSNGDIIFTDPPYGLRQPDGTYAPQDLAWCGVYRLSASDGTLTLLADDFHRPNGLVLTDDERRMYIDDTEHHLVRVFDVEPDGRLSNGKLFAEVRYGQTAGRPDGMKLDAHGNLYVTGNTPDGIWVYAPSGEHLGFIGVGEPPANLAWGGDDWKTLFVTATTSVYMLRMNVAGQPLRGM